MEFDEVKPKQVLEIFEKEKVNLHKMPKETKHFALTKKEFKQPKK